MAPPFTLHLSQSTFVSRRNFSTTEANASLTSMRSMSSNVMPAFSRQRVAAGPGELLVVEGEGAVVVVDRHQRLVEAALGHGGGGPVLAVDGEGVTLVAAEALDAGDQIGGDALGHHVVLVTQVMVVGGEAV